MKKLIIESLSKTYGKKKALNNFSYTFEENGIYAIIGENGAGKTTFLKILANLIKSDKGFFDVKLIDENKKESKGLVKGTIEEPSFNLNLSAIDNAYFYFGVDLKTEKNKEILSKFEILDVIDKKVSTYSLGMKQRLLLAIHLMYKADILFFDEPTISLDPKVIEVYRDLIKENSKGKITIVCSHDLRFLDSFIDNVIILNKGNIIKTISDMNKIEQIKTIKTKVRQNGKLIKYLESNKINYSLKDDYYIITTENLTKLKEYIYSCDPIFYSEIEDLVDIYMREFKNDY